MEATIRAIPQTLKDGSPNIMVKFPEKVPNIPVDDVPADSSGMKNLTIKMMPCQRNGMSNASAAPIRKNSPESKQYTDFTHFKHLLFQSILYHRLMMIKNF